MATLRERTKRQTRQLIHEAAAQLALERGPAEATLDAIAERAGISRRTFFNYFPSKEDAIIGAAEPTLGAEAAARFRSGEGSLLLRTAVLHMSVLRSILGDAEAIEDRRRLFEVFPDLRDRLVARGEARAEEIVTSFLVEELASSPSAEPASSADAELAASVVVANSRIVLQLAHLRHAGALDAGDEAVIAEAVQVYGGVMRRLDLLGA